MAQNHTDLLTEDGHEFVETLCTTLQHGDPLEPLLNDYEISPFSGGTGERKILPLPDALVREPYVCDSTTDTSFVIKVADRARVQNCREITVWNDVCDRGYEHGSLFAPIYAWNADEYDWLIMQRVVPISPIKYDMSYLLSGQRYIYDDTAPDDLESELNRRGWTITDVDMNTGLLNGNRVCLMDYGTVDRADEPIDLPIATAQSPS